MQLLGDKFHYSHGELCFEVEDTCKTRDFQGSFVMEMLQVCAGHARKWWELLDIRGNLLAHAGIKATRRLYRKPGMHYHANYKTDQTS